MIINIKKHPGPKKNPQLSTPFITKAQFVNKIYKHFFDISIPPL